MTSPIWIFGCDPGPRLASIPASGSGVDPQIRVALSQASDVKISVSGPHLQIPGSFHLHNTFIGQEGLSLRVSHFLVRCWTRSLDKENDAKSRCTGITDLETDVHNKWTRALPAGRFSSGTLPEWARTSQGAQFRQLIMY